MGGGASKAWSAVTRRLPDRRPPDRRRLTDRHAAWLAWLAIVLAGFLAIAWWSGFGATYVVPAPRRLPYRDMDLYRDIAAQVAAGSDYYRAAIAAHMAHGYPVVPWVTVRLPAHAWLMAGLGEAGLSRVAQMLLFVVAGAWTVALHKARCHPLEVIAAPLAILAGGFMVFYMTFLMHEMVASLILALGFALWRTADERATVACVLAACLVREFAILALLVGMALAVVDRRWRDLRWWLAALVAVALVYAWHAGQVIAARDAAAVASQGWHGRIGASGAMYTVVANSILRAAGMVTGGLLLLLALLGWLAAGARAWLVVPVTLGWLLAIAIFARTDNVYWAQLIVVWVPLGLVFLPRFVVFALSGGRHGRATAEGAA